MYMDNENHSPSLFGFDLFRLISLHIHTYGFSLSILPNWFWVHVCFFGEGPVVSGALARRGFDGCRMSTQPLPAGVPRFEYSLDDGIHTVRIGQVFFDLARTADAQREFDDKRRAEFDRESAQWREAALVREVAQA